MLRNFLTAAFLVATSTAQPQNTAKPKGSDSMPVETAQLTHRQIVKELFETCFNQGHTDRLSDLIAADYQGPNGLQGPASFAATITQMRTTITNIHYTLEDLVAENDRIAVRWRWEGRQDGPFRGFPATHKRVTSTGMAIFEFQNGKITRSWLQMDQLGLLQQIGALPPEIKPSTSPQLDKRSHP
jgi:steroid delta-isomerase-like uncharacterized protein